jgi:hypothetical protein
LDKFKILKIIERAAWTVAIIAGVWSVIVASRLEEPAYNPKLLLPVIIGGVACVFLLIALSAQEAEEFGWVHVAISIISLILAQVISVLIF